jgi:hypothetical protein
MTIVDELLCNATELQLRNVFVLAMLPRRRTRSSVVSILLRLPLALPYPGSTPRWSNRTLSYSYVNERREQVSAKPRAESLSSTCSMSPTRRSDP